MNNSDIGPMIHKHKLAVTYGHGSSLVLLSNSMLFSVGLYAFIRLCKQHNGKEIKLNKTFVHKT